MSTERDDYAKSLADWQRREAAGQFDPAPATPPPALSANEQFVLDQRRQLLEQKLPWYKSLFRREYDRTVKRRQREYVLGRIHNSRLKELVEAAYLQTQGESSWDRWVSDGTRSEVRWLRESKDYLENSQDGENPDAQAYRNWVRKRLQQSDLSTLLPGGRESLPDIYQAMREPWASIERLGEPKNYKQLINHVVRHLDWYLDPSQLPKPPIWQISIVVAIVVLGSLFGAAQHFEIPILKGLSIWWYWGGIAFTVWLSNALARYFAPHKIGNEELHGFYRVRGLINAAELFYYLVEAYSESDEPEPQAAAEY